MPRGDRNLCTPNAAVLAADAWVQQHGVCDEGCVNLMGALFGMVRRDLEHGQRDARDWLDTPAFTEWAEACRVDPDTLRDHLLDDYWRVCA